MQAEGKLEVSRDTYKNLVVSGMRPLCPPNYIDLWLQSFTRRTVEKSDMDLTLPLKDQETTEVVKVVASVRWISCFMALLNGSLALRLKKNIPSSKSTATLGRFTCSCSSSSTTTATTCESRPPLLLKKSFPPMWVLMLQGHQQRLLPPILSMMTGMATLSLM
jgi:hypothetical protein